MRLTFSLLQLKGRFKPLLPYNLELEAGFRELEEPRPVFFQHGLVNGETEPRSGERLEHRVLVRQDRVDNAFPEFRYP